MGRLACLVLLGGCWTGSAPVPTTSVEPVVVRAPPRCPVLVEPLYFEEGRTTLAPDEAALLDELALGMRCLIEKDARRFKIVGHADSAEADPQLTAATRTFAVVRELTARGVPDVAVAPVVAGSWDPLDVSGTDDARARNRRVHIDPD